MSPLLNNKKKESSFFFVKNNFIYKIIQPPTLIQLLKSRRLQKSLLRHQFITDESFFLAGRCT